MAMGLTSFCLAYDIEALLPIGKRPWTKRQALEKAFEGLQTCNKII